MSRKLTFVLIPVLIALVLACSFVTQPIKDVKNLAGTAKAIGTAIPIETLKALPSSIPIETLEALPSLEPTLKALSTSIPDFEKYFNPQGTPVQTWKDIPIMSQATAGQEFNDKTYSFKATVTTKEAQDFYSGKLKDLGWTQPFNLPSQSDTAFMLFQKDNSTLTITIAPKDGSVVVILVLA